MLAMDKPIIAITMGDPAGIGAEIVVKSLNEKEIYEICRPLVIGDGKVMEHAINQICKLNLKANLIREVAQAVFNYGIVDVLDLDNIDMSKFQFGKVSALCGKASYEYIEKAVELALKGKVHAIATGPINKESLSLAGIPFPGHTEILAHLTNTKDFSMMLITPELRVIHVSTHVSLREAIERVKKERVLKVIKLAYEGMKLLGYDKPRIAVAGLNPHAGEGGLFGDEEIKEIIPALEEAKRLGYNVSGPYPPDTVFVRARGGSWDIVVVMYHDQGHVPVKLIGMKWDANLNRWVSVRGVNVTIGLPIIRTSVDHGTAYGKAGKGTANHESMMDAIKYAALMVKNLNK